MRNWLKSWIFNPTTPLKEYDPWFMPIGDISNIFGGGNHLTDFCEVPELNAILNIRARALSSWRLSLVNERDNARIPVNSSLIKLLKKPNWFQATTEFWRQSSLFHDIYGNEYLYFLTPVGAESNYQGIFTLNPSQVNVEYKSHDIYFTIETGENVKYTWRDDYGGIHPLNKDDIIHLNDNRVKSGNIMKGTSKLESLQPAINNIRSAYIKRGINLTMPPGIFSNKDKNEFGQAVPLVKEEKEKAQKQLRTRGPVPIFTNMNINYSALDVSSKKMGLFDETIESTGRLCDAFGVPYKLLASKEAGTLNSGGNDVKESRKQMYEDTIIPDAQEKLDAINQFIKAEKTGWKVVATWDHLPIFASDIKEIAATNKVNVDGINTILNMVISDEAKVFLLVDVYGYTDEQAQTIIP